MPINLTPQHIKGLKPTDKRQEFRDTGAPNLYLVVQPRTGEKSFVMRVMVEGKQRKVRLGHFPALSLAEARERAMEHKTALRRGESVLLSKNASKAAVETPIGLTVQEAWDLYWEHEGSSRRSGAEKQRIFSRDIAPSLGSKPLNEVTRQDLAKLINEKFATAKTGSNRLHSLLARFFKWCFTHGESLTNLQANPMASVPKMHSERNSARKRYLIDDELCWWFEALPAAGDYRAIHELLMRTMCRFSDIFDLTWGEVVKHSNGDWVLELAETKNDQPHVVYLHPSAFALLPGRPENAKRDQRVFKVSSRSGKPVERLRKKMMELAAKSERTVPHWQPHDYRRTGTTHLAEMINQEDNPVVLDHVLDRLLAHKEQRVIRHYNRYAYYREKKNAITAWNTKLDTLSKTGTTK